MQNFGGDPNRAPLQPQVRQFHRDKLLVKLKNI